MHVRLSPQIRGLLETETISTYRLRKLKRGRRLPWLLVLLLLAILAAGVGLGLEDRQRWDTEVDTLTRALAEKEAARARLEAEQEERERAFAAERARLQAVIAERDEALAARTQTSTETVALADRVRPLLPAKGVEIQATPQGLAIQFDNRVLFSSNTSFDLSLDGVRALVRLATLLKELPPHHHFSVVSRIDERQVRQHTSTWALAAGRAASVIAQLSQELQTDPVRLSATTFVDRSISERASRTRAPLKGPGNTLEIRIATVASH